MTKAVLNQSSDATFATDNRQLGKYCGGDRHRPPESVVTSDLNNVKVTFQSDGSINGMGFRLEWAIHGCGAHFDKDSGTIQSPPAWFNLSSSVTECVWTISSTPGTRVQINITSANIVNNHIFIHGGQVRSQTFSDLRTIGYKVEEAYSNRTN